jgi:hypothetical protein
MVTTVNNRRRILGLDVFTLPRPSDIEMADRASLEVLYVRSYLAVRSAIGVVGVALPIALMVAEGMFTTGGLRPQSSLSAYYHTTMEDLFVAGLSFVGLLLLLYVSGQRRTIDFAASTIAGLALLGVVFFPINRDLSRPGVTDQHPCGPHTVPEPTSCSPTESTFGEHQVAIVHTVCATVFLLSLAAISFTWAYSVRRGRHPRSWWVHAVCGSAILVALLWAIAGSQLGPVSCLYAGEVVSVWAFGLSWLIKGEGLRTLLLRRNPHGRAGPDQAA